MSSLNRALERFFVAFMVVNFVLIVYIANIQHVAFNNEIYQREFERNDVYSDVPNANSISDKLIGYFKSEDGKIPIISEFNPREWLHIIDVKHLFDGISLTFLVLLILEVLLLFFFLKSSIGLLGAVIKVVFYGSILVGLTSVMLYFFSGSFQYLFNNLHPFFFKGDSWLFNSGDTIINLFPLGFFRNVSGEVVKNVFFTGFFGAVISAVPYFVKRYE